MPVLEISPKSVAIGVGQTQQFKAFQDGLEVEAEWSILPPRWWAGKILPEAGLYTAPPWIFLSRKVVVMARPKTGGAPATAEVDLSSAQFWTQVVGAYLLICFVALLGLLAFRWEAFCPTCKPDLVRVSPPVVTLMPSQSQSFTANLPAQWRKGSQLPGQDLSGEFLYIAPQTPPTGGKETVTATSPDKPPKSGTAEVYLSSVGGLTLTPARATISSGGSVDLTAIPNSPLSPAAAAGTTPPSGAAENAAAPTVEWLSPELGTVTSPPANSTTARFSVAGKIERPVTVLVLARVTGSSPRIAGAWITVLPPSTPLGTSIDTCGTDVESLLRLIALLGALGGIIHGISSFTTFVGNREFRASWVWWYLFKPVLSALVALVVYLVFRAGFGGSDYTLVASDCLKVSAFAGLIGLFAEPATLKLRDIFETIFTPRKDPRQDPAGQGRTASGPQLDSLSPASLTVHQADLPSLILSGSGFAKDCKVKVGADLRTPDSTSSSTRLVVPLKPADVEKATKLDVIVYNKPPDGEASRALELKVEEQPT